MPIPSIPGKEARHSWDGGRAILNDLTKGLYPRYHIVTIGGLRSTADAELPSEQNTGREGERPRYGVRRGKTLTYEGRIEAQTLAGLREGWDKLLSAFWDPSSEKTMVMQTKSGLYTPAATLLTNEITNPNFETGLTDWQASGMSQFGNYIPNPSLETNTTGWATSGFSLNAGATLTRTTAVVFSDGSGDVASGSVVTTNASAAQGVSAAATGNTFQAGTTYTAQVWMRGAVGGELVQVLLGATADDVGTANYVLTTAWKRYTVSWVPTANRSGADHGLTLRTQAATAMTFYFDHAHVYLGALNATPYFDGSTAGYAWTGTAHGSTSQGPSALVNLIKNPSAEVNHTDSWAYSGLTGARVADSLAPFGGYVFEVTSPTGGNGSMRNTNAMFPVTEGLAYSASAFFRSLAGSRQCQVYIDWYDSNTARINNTVSPIVMSTPDEYVRAEVVNVIAPAGAVKGQLIVHIANMAAGEKHYIDGIMAVQAPISPGYHDGSVPGGGSWKGVAHNSMSLLPSFTYDTSWAARGSRSARFVSPTGYAWIHPAYMIPVTPGEEYTFQTKVNVLASSTTVNGAGVPVTGVRVTVQWLNAAQNAIVGADTTDYHSALGEYTIALIDQAPVNAFYASLYIEQVQADFLLDDVVFAKSDVEVEYFDGSTLPEGYPHDRSVRTTWEGAANASRSFLKQYTLSYSWQDLFTYKARVVSVDGPESQIVGPNRSMTGGYERPFIITLRMGDPRFMHVTPVVNTTGAVAAQTSGIIPPVIPPVTMPTSLTGASVAVLNEGSAPAKPKLKIYGPVKDPVVTNETLNVSLSFPGVTLAAGQWLDVDFNTRQVLLEGTSDYRRFQKGDWWDRGVPGLLQEATNTIRLGGTTISDPARVEVTFNPARY